MRRRTEQLEREIAATRGQLSKTIDALRSAATIGHLADDAVDYLLEGPLPDFSHNLVRDIRDNPLPMVLIAAGVVWLFIAAGKRARSTAIPDPVTTTRCRTRPNPHAQAAKSARSSSQIR
jgi:Protein of unknown function (DUF3618)